MVEGGGGRSVAVAAAAAAAVTPVALPPQRRLGVFDTENTVRQPDDRRTGVVVPRRAVLFQAASFI
jgi:hypothetical protein